MGGIGEGAVNQADKVNNRLWVRTKQDPLENGVNRRTLVWTERILRKVPMEMKLLIYQTVVQLTAAKHGQCQ